MLESVVSQKVGYNLVTEQQQQNFLSFQTMLQRQIEKLKLIAVKLRH